LVNLLDVDVERRHSSKAVKFNGNMRAIRIIASSAARIALREPAEKPRVRWGLSGAAA